MARITVFLALVVTGCAPTKYVDRPFEVRVPVPIQRQAPQWLSDRYTPEYLPVFIAPSDPSAHAALAEQDLNYLKALLRTLKTRDEAWRAWAAPQGTPSDVQPQSTK